MKNNISWFRGWFIFFSPLLYFGFGIGKIVYFIHKNESLFNKEICKADTTLQSSEATTGVNNSYYSTKIKVGKMIALEFPIKVENDRLNNVEQDYLGEKWAYAHPELSNAGIGESPKEIERKAKIRVWWHPKSGIAYVISESKYEKYFPANEIIWRNLKWFIGFTIFPFYFFCRWIIEWIRVMIERRKIEKNMNINL